MLTAGANGPGQLVGVLGGGRTAAVDPRGVVAPERAGWELGWWIGADDRWHNPATDAAVRQSRVDDMPVFRTAMRVPGGDAVQHVCGAGELAVVEITNDSPAPFVVALVVHGAARLGLEDRVIGVDGRPAVITARGPSRWAAELDGTTEQVVMSGQAHEGPFRPVTSRAGRLTAAFLYPVAHRTTFRAAVGLAPSGLRVDDLDLDVASLPAHAAAARGWRAQLDRALRVELPDPVLQHAIDGARADVLLAGQAWMPDPKVVAALEDWGFDDEVRAAWPRLPGRARRRLGKRTPPTADWDDVARQAQIGGAPLLQSARAALLAEADAEVALLPALPDSWRGQPVDVRDAPTRRGPVSFSVRWHGERAALLWEAPPGTRITAPGLDAAWSSDAESGEALLGG
jgi:hypothetical protein